jgi:hypothetical protein
MKKLFVLSFFVTLYVYASAQQVFHFVDMNGRTANVAFSGANMLVEQGGIVKTFSPVAYNMYNWVSTDGYRVIFSADMFEMNLSIGETNYLFKMQAVPPVNSYQPYNGGGSNQLSTPSAPSKRRCGYCNGTGRVDSYVATYGNTDPKWCPECGKYMSPGHCHGCKICPSCGGKGYTESYSY